MSSSIGKHFRSEHSLAPKDLNKNFKILKKCKNKFDCLVYEMFNKFFLHILLATFTHFYLIHFPYIFLPLCHFLYLYKFILSTFRLIMTEERSKRRQFLPLVFIVNCFKKTLTDKKGKT